MLPVEGTGKLNSQHPCPCGWTDHCCCWPTPPALVLPLTIARMHPCVPFRSIPRPFRTSTTSRTSTSTPCSSRGRSRTPRCVPVHCPPTRPPARMPTGCFPSLSYFPAVVHRGSRGKEAPADGVFCSSEGYIPRGTAAARAIVPRVVPVAFANALLFSAATGRTETETETETDKNR